MLTCCKLISLQCSHPGCVGSQWVGRLCHPDAGCLSCLVCWKSALYYSEAGAAHIPSWCFVHPTCTSFLLCCTFLQHCGGEQWGYGSHGKWIYIHFVIIYRQLNFKQRSEKLVFHGFICQDHSLGHGTLCSYARNLPWSVCGWQLWIYQMRKWTVNSTSSNKKPFSSLIYLSPALWLCSGNDPPPQVRGCANEFRL